jgi:Serine dehydrogenase proteinase
MKDGREIESLLDKRPANQNLRDEVRRAIADIEAIRQRPLVVYAANVVKPSEASGIVGADDLPFAEMITQIPAEKNAIDVLIATPGGSAQQVSKFVNRLRPRFEDVAYLIPDVAMSAGTIWVMSGDEIWMDERAVIGPIDPQVPGRDGRLLPLQGLRVLVDEIRVRGEEMLKKGQQPAWSDIAILRNIDPKELGNVTSASQYSIQLTTEYLRQFKFKNWKTRSDGTVVTDEMRLLTARKIAEQLCDHASWRTHSHGITREVADAELHLKIRKPESVDGLQRAMRRLWALLFWIFENTLVTKVVVSQGYSLFRLAPPGGGAK